MSVMEALERPSFTLGSTVAERYSAVYPLIGTFISLACGEYRVEGTLTHVIRPSAGAQVGPLVVVDTGRGLVAGPLLPGDRLIRP